MEALRKAARNPQSRVQDNEHLPRQIQEYVNLLLRDPQEYISDDPFLLAAKHGNVGVVKAIIHSLPVEKRHRLAKIKDPDGFYPIHYAADPAEGQADPAEGQAEVVRLLLDIEPGLCRTKDRRGWTPLHHAIIRANPPVMRVILETDFPSIWIDTRERETCLHIAVKFKQKEEFQLLLDHMNNTDKRRLLSCHDEEGNNILHTAVSYKLAWAVKSLVIPGSYGQLLNVNIKNAYGLTALNLCDRGGVDVYIKDLLRNGGAQKAHSFIAIVDPILNSTGESTVMLGIPSGVVLGTLALLGNPLLDSIPQNGEKQKVPIVQVLKMRHPSGRRFYSVLSLTILFVFSMLTLALGSCSAPTRLPLMVLLLLIMVYYCTVLPNKMSSFSINWGSKIIPSACLVGSGTVLFYVTVSLVILASEGKRLLSYFRCLRGSKIHPSQDLDPTRSWSMNLNRPNIPL